MKLGEALRRAGVLSALGAPGWLGVLLDAVDVDLPTIPDPLVDVELPLVLDRAPLFLAGVVRVTGSPTSARIVLRLDHLSLVLDAGDGAVTLTGSPGEMVIAVDDRGEVTTSLRTPDGTAVLTLDVTDTSGHGLQVLGAGGAGLALHPSEARLLVADGEPAVELDGRLTLTGLPDLGPAELLVTGLRLSSRGLSGRVSGGVAGAVWTVGWVDSTDGVPASLLVDLPISTVPGLTGLPGLEPGCRVRVTGGRGTASGGPPFDLAVEVLGGEHGIVTTDRPDVAAAALMLTATAGNEAGADGRTAPGAALGVAASLLPPIGPFHASGHARVSRVRVDLTSPRRVSFDYESDLAARVQAGPLDIGTTAAMRAVVRGVVLDWSGAPSLDWRAASIDVADPGQWKVYSPDRLLQVERTRSGTGSAWFEVDLRFVFDAGPVTLEGATVRVTFPTSDHDPATRISVRGLSARLDVPGLVTAAGSVSFAGANLHAHLLATLVPLNLNASASVDVGEGGSLLADIAVDLPSPVPLANTGLGLFGIAGTLGLDRAIRMPPDLDDRLDWKPDEDGTIVRDGAALLGFRVAVGTLPDLGHAFAAVGSLAVGTPDLAVVASISARLLGSRPSLADPVDDGAGPRLRGVLAVLPDEISLAVVAEYHFPDSGQVLLDAVLPVEARWPLHSSGWFVHLGTDRSRTPGPVHATVLPGILDDIARAEAFLMVEGDGLPDFPINAAKQGLVVAAGFDLKTTLFCGPVSAEIWAGATVAVSTRPVFLSGQARVGGRLRLGPFALGIDTNLTLQIGPGDTFAATLEICGEIDLWLFEISGCVTIELGDEQVPAVAPPESPLVSASVVSRDGAVVAPGDDGLPHSWPDATLQLGYTPAPVAAPPLPSPAPNPPPAHWTGPFVVDTSSYTPSGEVGEQGEPGAYQARYQLVGLDLVVVDGPPSAAPPAGMVGTWQTKPGQSTIPGDGAAMLALLTHNPMEWTGRLADGGRWDVSDPVGARVRE